MLASKGGSVSFQPQSPPQSPPLHLIVRLRNTTPSKDKGTGIYVILLSGEKLSINVDPSDTIDVVKAKINDATVKSGYPGVPPDMQRLIFAGKQLKDSCTISDYGIQVDCQIHMVLRLRGGMFHESSSGAKKSPTFCVHVNVRNECVPIEVEHDDTIVAVKVRVLEALHLSGACKLVFEKGHRQEHDELQDGCTLDDYNIREGCVLRLVLSRLE